MEQKNDKIRRAVLLAAAGAGSPHEAGGLKAIEALARRHFSPADVGWTYTSGALRRRMATHGVEIPDPVAALRGLSRAHYEAVSVLALHIYDGVEYQELCDAVAMARGLFTSCAINRPLFDSDAAMRLVLAELWAATEHEREPEALVVLVGHGSLEASAQARIARAGALCAERSERLIFAFGLGEPGPETVIQRCRELDTERICIIPFFLTAGRSVTALADQSEPFCQTLRAEGLAMRTLARGRLDYPNVALALLGRAG